MSQVTIQKLGAAQSDALLELLTRSGLPHDGLAAHPDTTWVAQQGDAVVGSAALELYGSVALLRSLAVDAPLRGHGIGEQLTRVALDEASNRGVREVYLLTETATEYFPRFGFHPVARDQVNPNVKQSVEFLSVCPESAQAMLLELKDEAAWPQSDRGDIKAAVREYYGERARNVGSSCCGDSSACCSDGQVGLYSPDELALVPMEAGSSSLGCGNPTALAGLRPGEVVLDLGSGGGLDVFLAAQKVGHDGFAYGVDMTDDMLALARRNAAKMDIKNVEFLKGDIEDIPLPDASVDVIISNCVINLSPDKGQTLRDAFRVLRPGGRLAVSDVVVDGRLDDLPVTEEQVRAALSWAGCIAGALTVDQYKSLLADAGFQQIDVAIAHRYTLDDLDGAAQIEAPQLPRDVASKLVGRFVSGYITARRP